MSHKREVLHIISRAQLRKAECCTLANLTSFRYLSPVEYSIPVPHERDPRNVKIIASREKVRLALVLALFGTGSTIIMVSRMYP